MRRVLTVITLVLLAGNLSFGQQAPRAFDKVDAATLSEWIDFLSSDLMKGRANGSPEMEKAAGWIATKFNEYGVVPLDKYPDYFQPYEASSRRGTFSERNVIGIIPGTDPALKDEYIILSAHFDHIGIRPAVDGDSICNGADDNAAGTATLIGIAKNISESKAATGRTILIVAFSGEEMGLRGSRYFVQNPPVDLARVYANMNFEMIGHSEEVGKNNFYMTGCSTSNLDDLVSGYIRNSGYTLIDTISLAERLFFQSDNISFARISTADGVSEGIPCGTFATTTTKGTYIHTPADEAELFDFNNMANLVNMFSGVVVKLSNSREPLDWTTQQYIRYTGK